MFDLGLAPYLPTQDLQARLQAAVAAGDIPGVLLLLEHPPVITLGSRGGEADVRSLEAARRLGLDLVRSERGGAATLHAPGQLVSYPVLRIPGRDLRAYVTGLEEVLIGLLASLGVSADRRPGAPGLYVGGRKIASVGLRCRRWVASHGTSLNVAVDLSLFDTIVSCGDSDMLQTSVLQESGSAPPMETVKGLYVDGFRRVFGLRLQGPTGVKLEDLADIALGI